ncbi:MAG: hypothetical protein ABIF01_03695 [Candidatus Micrarchaeota archaeon]
MGTRTRTRKINFEQSVFDIKDEPMPSGAWWWWFWLFFFDNPKNPSEPRQLMILWSTKNVREIQCNGLSMKIAPSSDRKNLDGAVAAWYFDGEKMHHNYILEQSRISISEKVLSSTSSTPTSFSVRPGASEVRIGDDFHFIAENIASEAGDSTYSANKYVGSLGYNIIRINSLSLKGTVGNENISGTAYFQRVFVNAPSPSWYWGVFHFENGGVLSYFNPHLFGKSLKKDIQFFDGEKNHSFKSIRVKRSVGETPTFTVSGENNGERISFKVDSYSQSSWTFKKKTLGILPNTLVYNEYPAVISEFELEGNGKKLTLKELGKGIGNAEHSTGFLL